MLQIIENKLQNIGIKPKSTFLLKRKQRTYSDTKSMIVHLENVEHGSNDGNFVSFH